MKSIKYILILSAFLRISGVFAQTDYPFLSHSNRLFLNPSFAGLNKVTNTWSGVQYFSESKYVTNSLFSFSFDKYFEQLKGGVGLYFHQGLTGEVNTAITETGISYSGFDFGVGRGRVIPSLNTNLSFATKQWFVFSVDRLLDKELEPPSPPGEEFARFYVFKPRLGLLYDSPLTQIGITFTTPFRKNMLAAGNENQFKTVEIDPFNLIFYFAMKKKGNRNGLVSTPFKMYPEAILFYRDRNVLSRVSLKVEHIDQTLGLFVQNNFFNQQHQLGGIYGWRFENIRINLTAGIGIPELSKTISFTGELTLGLTVPPVQYSEKNPWAPQKM